MTVLPHTRRFCAVSSIHLFVARLIQDCSVGTFSVLLPVFLVYEFSFIRVAF